MFPAATAGRQQTVKEIECADLFFTSGSVWFSLVQSGLGSVWFSLFQSSLVCFSPIRTVFSYVSPNEVFFVLDDAPRCDADGADFSSGF